MHVLTPAMIGRLRLKHLEVFRHAAEQSTLRRAAELTHMTQPAATKLIQELEEIVGTPLFVRGRLGVRLTKEGEMLSLHVHVLLADFARMAQDVALVREGGEGHIRLGVLPSLAPGLLSKAMSLSLQARPGVSFSIQEGSTNELLDALERNELHLAFARVLDRKQALRLNLTKVYAEPFAVVVGKIHPLTKVPSRRLWSALSSAAWVLPEEGTPLRATVEQLFARHKQLRPRASVECHVLDKVAELVANCGLVGVLPRSLATHGERGRHLRLLVDDIYFGDTSLVSRGHIEPGPLETEFIRHVQQAARDLKLDA